ncbi:hypothetical protein EIP86_003226 [Pleurotus ostreatoroseus]|nr:hypothetical protein EIP86_003226 [Pleurotus ostreatoroseus]
MPASIFPGGGAGGGGPALPPSVNMSMYARQSLLSPRRAGPSPFGPAPARRESRTLRSSPLAGPSLAALGADGTPSGEEENEDESETSKVRFRPNRISSTPDVRAPLDPEHEMAGVREKLRAASTSASAPATPHMGHRQLVLEVEVPAPLQERVINLNADERVLSTSPTAISPTSMSPTSAATASPVAEPATAKQPRRLSLGLKRLSALPGLPSLHRRATSREEAKAKTKTMPTGANANATTTTKAEPASPRRARTMSGPAPPSPTHPTASAHRLGHGLHVPPVPAIPGWARPATPSPLGRPDADPNASAQAGAHEKLARRPSTAPTGPGAPAFLSPAAAASSSSLGSVKSGHRRSHQHTQPHNAQDQQQQQPHPHPHRPFAPAHPPPTQTAEATWMTSAASPKFSRLGLKGAGVVLPVSAHAKEAKAIRRRSVMSGVGGDSASDLHSERGGSVGVERGKVLGQEGKKGIELRVNDVTVDVLDYHDGLRRASRDTVMARREPVEVRNVTAREGARPNVNEAAARAQREKENAKQKEKSAEVTVKKSGTLRRVWKRVVGR